MDEREHDTFREWLYLEPDGELSASEAARLAHHVAECDGCRREREELARMEAILGAEAIDVDREFVDRVMAKLPPAGWESRHPRTWVAAVAAFVMTAGAAALLTGSAGGGELGPVAGALAAVFELFRSAAVAGSGLLTASWTGVGLVVERALEESSGGFVAFALLVAGLDLLFLRLLARSRRGEPAPEPPAYLDGERRRRG